MYTAAVRRVVYQSNLISAFKCLLAAISDPLIRPIYARIGTNQAIEREGTLPPPCVLVCIQLFVLSPRG